ncbi:MAG TPA: hypothetical protein VGK30_18905 [Candidatus Binatia bacterium]
MPIRATCTGCHEIIVTTPALPLTERDVEVLAAHVRSCEAIPLVDRPSATLPLGDLLRYFAVDIQLD